jgi:DNA-binding beta-propeller fold protein YncE
VQLLFPIRLVFWGSACVLNSLDRLTEPTKDPNMSETRERPAQCGWPWWLGLLAALVGGAPLAAAERAPLKLVKTIPLKGSGVLGRLALDADHQRLFVANTANGTLDVVDLKAGKLLKQIPPQYGIQGVAYAPDLNRIIVGNGMGNVCNIFDGKTYKLLKSIQLDGADNVRYHAKSKNAYVGLGGKALAVIDVKNLKVRTEIKFPGRPQGFQIEKGRPRLYLNRTSPEGVVRIDLDSNRAKRFFPLNRAGGNYPLAIDEENRRLFIGCRNKPRLVVMDSESGKEVAAVTIPADVGDVHYDAKRKRIYASCGAGYVAVIRQTGANRYKLLKKVKTARQARTSLYDPASGKLYVAVPRQGQKGPELQVYQAR